MFKDGYKPYNYGMTVLPKESIGLWNILGPKIICGKDFPEYVIEDFLRQDYASVLISEVIKYNVSASEVVFLHNMHDMYTSIIQETLFNTDEPQLVLSYDSNYVAIIFGGKNAEKIFVRIFNLGNLSQK